MTEVKDASPREMIAEGSFEEVELSKLIESRRNPRKAFDEKANAELVESIKRYGVLTPLIVRAVGNDGKFEILAGARRSRASREAGLKTVPCRIVKVENDTALEVIVVENLQRANPHPLEEASSFAEILELSNGDVDGLCNTLGKKRSYVEKRLALNNLIDAGKKEFLQGKFKEDHAILIARLNPEEQKDALDYYKNDEPSPNVLREWIESELMLDLSKSGFSKQDEKLIPKAGPCTTCPKRTSVSKELFDDIKAGDRCTDGACFKLKMQAHIANLEKALKEKGKRVYGIYDGYQSKVAKGALPSGKWVEIKKRDFCEKAATGIILDYGRAGHFIDICADLEHCKIHGKTGMHGSTGTQQEAMRKQMLANKKEAEVRLRVFKQVYEKQGVLDLEAKRIVTEGYYERLWFAAKVRLCKAMGLEPKVSKLGGKDYDRPFKDMLDDVRKDETMDKILVAIASAGDLDPNCTNGYLDSFQDLLKVDREAIEKEVAESFAKKAKKMPKQGKIAKGKTPEVIDQREKKPKKAKKAASGAQPQTQPYVPDPLENSDSGGDTE